MVFKNIIPTASPLEDRRKIIFISCVKKPPYLEYRFYFDHLIAHNFDVEFWDLSRLFGVGDAPCSNVAYVIQFESRRKVIEHIKRNSTNLFVILFNIEYRFLWIYRLLSKYRCKIFYFSWGHFPRAKTDKKHTFFDALMSPKNIYKKFIMYFYKYMKLTRDCEGIFFAGDKRKEHLETKKYIPINLPDFEEYCDLLSGLALDTKDIPTEKYLVFLDSYLPFHPDFRRNNLPTIDPERYRVGISNFFKKVEDDLGMRIIIAAHPKSEYPLGYFGKRVLIKNKTAQLVMKSQGVISHYSTSTAHAVLWRKPILFISSYDIRHCAGAEYMELITTAMAKELNMPLYNIDHLPKTVSFPEVRENVYEEYKRKYITTNTCFEKRNKDIMLQTFLKATSHSMSSGSL